MIAKYQKQLKPNAPQQHGKYTLFGLVPETGESEEDRANSKFTSFVAEKGGTEATDTQDKGTESAETAKFTRVTRAWSEMQSLRQQLREKQNHEDSMIGQVLSDEIAPYILSKIVEAHTMELRRLNENLTAPYGWLALGKLLQARMIDAYGEVLVPTEVGRDFLTWFEREQEVSDYTDSVE